MFRLYFYASATLPDSLGIIFLEGSQVGVAWEPFNKVIYFLPLSKNKVSLTSPLNFFFASTLHLSSCLFLDFKVLKYIII
jgi:hypothetical protein